jgi:LmbE family N-acetylglucosaminyl deacetylase
MMGSTKSTETLRLMAVLAHPDDESMALGGTLVAYAAEGVEISIVTATRGELGWRGSAEKDPGPEALGRIREGELRAAAQYLGVSEVVILDYVDGELQDVDVEEATARIATEIRRFRPHVVVTFGPDGVYGHPDHIAISQLTTSAVMRAADPALELPGYRVPHSVSKLYYRIWTEEENEAYAEVFGETTIDVQEARRSVVTWPEWSVSTQIDTTEFWTNVWGAVRSHRSQLGDVSLIDRLSNAAQERLWGRQSFYRAMSTVGLAGAAEHDLFAGLRESLRFSPTSVV